MIQKRAEELDLALEESHYDQKHTYLEKKNGVFL